MLGLEFSLFLTMLRFLRIRHLAVIDAVEVEFEPGPQRPDRRNRRRQVDPGRSRRPAARRPRVGRPGPDRRGDGHASKPSSRAAAEELLVRREITAQGRSRAFINGELATAGALKDLAGRLIELHGQHEHQTLLDPATHLGVLDAFGAARAARVHPSRAAFEAHARDGRRARARCGAAWPNATRGRSSLTFQLAELDRAASLQSPGEDDGARGDAPGAGERRARRAAVRRKLRGALRERRRGAGGARRRLAAGRRAGRARSAVSAVPRRARRHQVAARGSGASSCGAMPTASTRRRRGCSRSKSGWRCSSG